MSKIALKFFFGNVLLKTALFLANLNRGIFMHINSPGSMFPGEFWN